MKSDFRNNIYIYLLHIFGWMCFLFYPFFLGVPFREDILIKFILHTILLAIFFYTNTNLLIPKILSKKRITFYFLIVSGIIGLIVLLNITFNHFLDLDLKNLTGNSTAPPPENLQMKRIARAIISSLFIFAFSTSYKLLMEWFQAERKTQEIQNETLTSELSFLKSQVSPHFLFNTLNNIYSLSLTPSEKTSAAILKLSQLLRYMLYESDGKQVFLEKEIEYLNNYIDLQKMRMTDKVKINFTINGDLSGKIIEPMLLIPFVENAFKHGINCSNCTDINISVETSDRELVLLVANPKNNNKEADPASGIGLLNVQRRLNLLYPGKHALHIEDQNEKFIVNLRIEFTEHEVYSHR